MNSIRINNFFFLNIFALCTLANAMKYVVISDPFNPSDSSGKGSVSYTFAISETEVPASDYVDFLNSVASTDTYSLFASLNPNSPQLISRTGSSGSYNYTSTSTNRTKPVSVSVTGMLRYINWLHNSKPIGAQNANTTENGAYTFFGQNSYTLRNPSAQYWLPNENEWRKAAFYDPVTKTHRLYPHGSDNPTPAVGNTSGDVANPSPTTYVYNSTLWGSNTSSRCMSVGTSGSYSAWGVLDLAGNEWEIFEPVTPGLLDIDLFGGNHSSTSSLLRRTSGQVNNVGSVTYAGFHIGKLSAGDSEVDTDNDGVPNSMDEDDDNDGVTDANEIILGTNQFVSDLQLFQRIRENPQALDLFKESDILNFRTGGFACKINGNQISLTTPVAQSENLADWSEVGVMRLDLPMTGNKKFYRFTLSP